MAINYLDMEGLFSDSKLGELEDKIDALVSNYRGVKAEKEKLCKQLEKQMRQAAEQLDFELAIQLRDQLAAIEEELQTARSNL